MIPNSRDEPGPTGRIHDESLYRFHQAQPSYWEVTAGDRRLDAAPVEGDESCEVAIIGGGYTGLSAALHLARDFSIDVRVLEAGHIGWGASGRNGGFCSIGGTKLETHEQIERYGLEETRRYFRSQVEAIELVRTLGEEEGIDFQRQGDGEITVAHEPGAYPGLVEQAQMYRDVLGIDARTMTRDEFRERGYDSREQFGALVLRPTFGLHPLRYALGLARAAIRHGARLHPRSEVLEWGRDGGEHRLRTAGGTLRAKRVIVACNGFMPEHLHRTLEARALPAVTNIVVSRPLSDAELEAHRWRNPCPTISARHVYFYYRMLPDRRFMLGGRAVGGSDAEAAAVTYAQLERRIGEIWPGWRALEFEYRWRGLVCMTRDLRPAIGKFPDDRSVMFGFGYHGNGVNTATWTGRMLAYWLAGSNSGDSDVPEHLPALVRGLTRRFPFPRLRRLYLRAGVAWYRWRDFAGA